MVDCCDVACDVEQVVAHAPRKKIAATPVCRALKFQTTRAARKTPFNSIATGAKVLTCTTLSDIVIFFQCRGCRTGVGHAKLWLSSNKIRRSKLSVKFRQCQQRICDDQRPSQSQHEGILERSNTKQKSVREDSRSSNTGTGKRSTYRYGTDRPRHHHYYHYYHCQYHHHRREMREVRSLFW